MTVNNLAYKNHIVTLLFICLGCSSPHAQNKNKVINMELKYQSDSLEKYIPKMLEVLKQNGFVFLGDVEFKNKVIELMGVDMDTCQYFDIPFEQCSRTTEEWQGLSNGGIILDKKFICIPFAEMETFFEKDIKSTVTINTFVNYNKLIFNNDKIALTYLRFTDPQKIFNIVNEFGYINKNDSVLSVAFDYGLKNAGKDILGLILKNPRCNDISPIRDDVLAKVVELNPELLKKIVTYMDIGEIDQYDLSENKKSIVTAHILNALLEIKDESSVNHYFDTHPNYINTLKKNNYYNFIKLKEIAQDYSPVKTYDQMIHNYAEVIDQDGFTNLRVQPNSNSKILTTIKTGTVVNLEQQSGDWWKVQIGSQTGYVHKSKVKIM